MTALGIHNVDDMIGRVDKLVQKSIAHPRQIDLDLGQLLYRPDSDDDPRKTREQNHGLDGKLDHDLIEQASNAIENGEPVVIEAKINNRDRTAGTLLSSAVTRRHGDARCRRTPSPCI